MFLFFMKKGSGLLHSLFGVSYCLTVLKYFSSPGGRGAFRDQDPDGGAAVFARRDGEPGADPRKALADVVQRNVRLAVVGCFL